MIIGTEGPAQAPWRETAEQHKQRVTIAVYYEVTAMEI
jgi:hypothetical protein